MISFGDLKNNLTQLKKYLVKMQLFNQQFSIKELDEQNLRKRKNQTFLPLLNFILLKYSTDLIARTIQKVPGIRIMKDKDFVQNSFNVCRNILGIDIILTSEQFLNQKYFDKKVQFLADLSKKVYQWDQIVRKRKNKFEKKQNQIYSKDLQNFDEDQQEIRQFDIKPYQQSIKQKQQKFVNKKINKLASYLEQQGQSYIQEKPQKYKKIQLKKTKRWNEDNEQQEEQEKQFYGKKIIRQVKKENVNFQPKQYIQKRQNRNNLKMQKNILEEKNDIYDKYLLKQKAPIPKYPCEQKEEEYVTKQQFHQVIALVKTLTQSINHNAKIFQDFQVKIQNQYDKMNARLSFMEASVKMLKDNL